MATETTNYKLIKPEQTDYYDVDVFNDNADIVDTALAGKSDEAHSHSLSSSSITGTLPTSKGGTGNTSIDTTPTSGSIKMVTSGGVYTALSKKADSTHTHTGSDITDLSCNAAVITDSSGNLIDAEYNTQSDYLGVASDNVQFITPDTIPTNGSGKLITSGGVYEAINTSRLANNVHRIDVTIDNNYKAFTVGLPGYTFDTVKKISGSTTYANGDIVFVTFRMDADFTESENAGDYKDIYINDDVFEGTFGVIPLYYFSHMGTSGRFTLEMLPTGGNIAVAIMFTLYCVSESHFRLYAYI